MEKLQNYIWELKIANDGVLDTLFKDISIIDCERTKLRYSHKKITAFYIKAMKYKCHLISHDEEDRKQKLGKRISTFVSKYDEIEVHARELISLLKYIRRYNLQCTELANNIIVDIVLNIDHVNGVLDNGFEKFVEV